MLTKIVLEEGNCLLGTLASAPLNKPRVLDTCKVYSTIINLSENNNITHFKPSQKPAATATMFYNRKQEQRNKLMIVHRVSFRGEGGGICSP